MNKQLQSFCPARSCTIEALNNGLCLKATYSLQTWAIPEGGQPLRGGLSLRGLNAIIGCVDDASTPAVSPPKTSALELPAAAKALFLSMLVSAGLTDAALSLVLNMLLSAIVKIEISVKFFERLEFTVWQ